VPKTTDPDRLRLRLRAMRRRVTVASVDDLRGANALLTGAAGGLGRHIAFALAAEGVRVAVSGRNRDALDRLCQDLRRDGATAEPVTADLSNPAEAAALVERAEAEVGPLDLLISNAALEVPGAYPAFTDPELEEITYVNLIAPMVLARHALPGMSARGRGHVIVVSSLAGRGGNAYNVLYAATKAGLVGFTRSLRAELADTPVSASVICPSFIARDGMYAEMQHEAGVNAPIALRPVEPDRVADAVVRAIVDDTPDELITGWPMRPILALQELAPRLAERILAMTGAPRFFAQIADHTDRRWPSGDARAASVPGAERGEDLLGTAVGRAEHHG
jgi:NAD(P)-dependent dehydrogenase (short-subunit alcohol dehydrogenase family)